MNVLAHTHPLASQIEAALLPLFQAALPQLTASAPGVLASVFAFSSGNASAFEDYHFGISCLLEPAQENAADEVALLVSVSNLATRAQLQAQVAWGQPSGKVEARAELAEASVAALQQALPGLIDALHLAVKRQQP